MNRRMNRYAQMRRHKRKLKQKYGHGLYTGYRTNLKLHEDECRANCGNWPNDRTRNGGYEYWQSYYLTGPRTYARRCTNRAIRAMYRDLLKTLADLEDVQALSGSDYEKAFDYDWAVW